MAPSHDAIVGIVLQSLHNLNEEREAGSRVPVGIGTSLFGSESLLDSLSLVSVIVDVESALAEQTGQTISLMDDRALSQAQSPFATVGTLVSYIETLVPRS